ncbi:GNAT family N-acetyltransferase [Mucilaginibacter terrigena]|uniref:GNAT family N-acetyltransferase n=1 Tax=Mucilaginibacter terrigena TaxID=2492395 RepID=A0A4Q5LSD8_9SPHI|nr:arsenic resistance N-acetyltransferase ArsN2 [Mucilaginibacter terrigena]RYU92498.1 GNAT family N-acetyltransferase [Mucilaginibacter terrigena]
MEIKPAVLYRDDVINKLTTENLPTADINATLDDFFVATEDNQVIGIAGLEVYGNYGLLRSVAVVKEWRGKGVAAELLNRIEAVAGERGLEAIYLLTETAKDYFEGKGYEHVARMDIPEAVKASSEFTHVCQESATAMQKSL